MNDKDKSDLRKALLALEYPGIGAKIAGVLGTPVHKAMMALPEKAKETVGTAVEKAIHAALLVAIKTIGPEQEQQPASPDVTDLWHKVAAGVTGAAGGAFGVAALALELPVSTTIIMRSIANIARSEGADLSKIETQLECLEVLALGGQHRPTGMAAYFLARDAMTRALSEAAAHIARSGLQRQSASALIRFITAIAERYSIVVTEKVAAELVPVLGAVGGATINALFIDHFQKMAHAHFTVRRLERNYGVDYLRQNYMELLSEMRKEREAKGKAE